MYLTGLLGSPAYSHEALLAEVQDYRRNASLVQEFDVVFPEPGIVVHSLATSVAVSGSDFPISATGTLVVSVP